MDLGRSAVLTLPSNASAHLFPDNTTSCYRVKLPRTLNFVGEWEIGLTGFNYSRTWYNFPIRESFFAVVDRFLVEARAASANGGEGETDDDDDGDNGDGNEETSHDNHSDDNFKRTRVNFTHGHYSSPSQILNVLNDSRLSDVLRYSYSSIDQKIRIVIRWGDRVRVRFSADLSLKLGWPPGKTVLWLSPGETLVAPNVLNLDNLDLIFVHCDIAQDSHIVGGQLLPLLKTVSVSGYYGDNTNYEPKIVDWLPLRASSFHTARVLITDAEGQTVPFEKGNCSVKVHLRRTRPF